MKRSGSTPRLSKCHSFLILFTRFQHLIGRPPISFGHLGETPGVTLPAGEVATRLINGQIIFRPGKMNGRDKPESSVVRLFESGLTGQGLSSINFDKTTALGISLLD
jgi:hypothetical protein